MRRLRPRNEGDTVFKKGLSRRALFRQNSALHQKGASRGDKSRIPADKIRQRICARAQKRPQAIRLCRVLGVSAVLLGEIGGFLRMATPS